MTQALLLKNVAGTFLNITGSEKKVIKGEIILLFFSLFSTVFGGLDLLKVFQIIIQIELSVKMINIYTLNCGLAER